MKMEFEKINYPSNLLKDKTIVISGAGSGIGRQIARSYAEFGADLILLSKSIEKLESIYEEINQITSSSVIIQPIDFKIKNGVQKYMLRDIVGEYLSDTISYAPKRPLQTPQREWLANELKEEVSTIIDSIKHSNFKHWFNLEKLENEWQQYINGDQESSFHIWQWLSYSFAI